VAKCWLTIFAFFVFVPVLSAGELKKGCDPWDYKKCKVTADEGGSTGAYLLGVGVTCLGAAFFSARQRRLL